MSDDLAAADSWLLRDGRVRALDRHRARFAAACAAATGTTPGRFDAFWTTLLDALPPTGSWWPRVELGTDGALGWRLRPAPPQGGHVTVTTAPDTRRCPARKGPDLAALAALRTACGTGEVLLLDRHGHVVEGTTTNLLWWDGDTLCRPRSDPPPYRGITADLIAEEAARQGIPVEERSVTPAGTDGHEVWLVNAARGIRTVTGAPATRAPAWRDLLDARR